VCPPDLRGGIGVREGRARGKRAREGRGGKRAKPKLST